MLTWLIGNIGTIIISLILLVIIIVIIRHLIKNKKKGISLCGNKCGNCPMAGSCHINNESKGK